MAKVLRGLILLALALLASGAAVAQDRAIAGTAVAPPAPAGEKRVALVIGNSAYKNAPLRNPVNDAKAVAEALRGCGFDATLLTDATYEILDSAVLDLGTRLRGADVALFYYAGHGIQTEGQNYLVPTDAVISLEREVKYRCVNVGLTLAQMEDSGAQVKIVILDACRNNPYERSWRSQSKGLAAIMEGPKGTIISYATGAGKVAADGPGDHGVYTEALLKHIPTPGLKVEDVFKRVRNDVERATDAKQSPWEYTSLTGDFYFVAKAYTIPPRDERPPIVIGPAEAPVPDVGLLQVNVNVPEAEVFVNGEARGASSPEKPLNLQGLPVGKVTVEVRAKGCQPLSQEVDLPRGRWQQVVFRLAPIPAPPPPPPPPPVTEKHPPKSPFEGGLEAGQTRSVDLGGGVTLGMVWCPPGTFTMGSPSGEKDRDNDERQHQVTLTKGFWLGKYEVTQEQWERVMGGNPSHFKGAKNPVECVSWNDAQAFCKKAGNGLRLPTEAEWEYACRAGSTTAYCFGSRESGLGDYAWYDRNSGSKTHPVGGKKPNAWGLYGMHGNVWEWCEDWYDEDYYAASPREDPCNSTVGSYRVVRGGSWDYDSGGCRSAYRDRYYPAGFDNSGFRVCCPASAR